METKPDEMDPKEARFCVLRACGHSQSDAFRIAWGRTRAKPESIHRMAHRVGQRVHVKSRIRELLREARITDIETVGQAYEQLLSDMQTAREQGNATALSSFTKCKFSALGLSRSEHVLVSPEKSESDDALVARLAQGDEHKATMLRALIGKDTFGDGEKDDEEK